VAIPKNVTICGYPYKVTMVDSIGLSNGAFLDGQIVYHDAEIEIVHKLPALFERSVVLHEVLHGVALHTGQIELKQDECKINALAFSLVTLLRSNPELVKYLTEEL
jgi:hypothetical protein